MHDDEEWRPRYFRAGRNAGKNEVRRLTILGQHAVAVLRIRATSSGHSVRECNCEAHETVWVNAKFADLTMIMFVVSRALYHAVKNCFDDRAAA